MYSRKIPFLCFLVTMVTSQKALTMPTDCYNDLNICGSYFCETLRDLEKIYQAKYGLDQKYKKWQRKWCVIGNSESLDSGVLKVKNPEIKNLCDKSIEICIEGYQVMNGPVCDNKPDHNKCINSSLNGLDLKRKELEKQLRKTVIKKIREDKDLED